MKGRNWCGKPWMDILGLLLLALNGFSTSVYVYVCIYIYIMLRYIYIYVYVYMCIYNPPCHFLHRSRGVGVPIWHNFMGSVGLIWGRACHFVVICGFYMAL